VSTVPDAFYDDLAEHFHLIFKDWQASIDWQAGILGPLIEREFPGPGRILDCCCGIGTQALGLAKRGHSVSASDASAKAVDRARREAAQRGLSIDCHVADVREGLPGPPVDVVLAADNALPHLLTDADLERAAASIHCRLGPGGIFVATVRDYDQLVTERPAMQPPAFFSDAAGRRFHHQVWDWTSERSYTLHLYLTWESAGVWQTRHHVCTYRALLRAELDAVLTAVGFQEVRWLMPAESGYYQPLVIARKAQT